jgi:8-amino-7-oxononanoate synthase
MTVDDLATRLRELSDQGLLRRRRISEALPGARMRVEGRSLLAFSSNDYLGLAADSRLAEALADGARKYGAGAGASHLVSGHHRAHHDLEDRLAAFVGAPRALLLSSGYAANLAILTTFADAQTEIFADRLNHASLNDGMLLSRARFHRYPHADLAALEALLRRAGRRRKLVVTDSVFSMDGDIAPLAELSDLCAREGAWLVVDDAHGFGVLGPQGRGALAFAGLAGSHLIYMGTLGKAAGVAGAFVAAAEEVVEMLVQRARTYIYTTALPPALAHALLTSVDIIAAEDWRRQRLDQLIRLLQTRLEATSFQPLPSRTPIQPVVLGSAAAAVSASAALERDGILVPAIRPPTVERGKARLRISLSAQHEAADVERLCTSLLGMGESAG